MEAGKGSGVPGSWGQDPRDGSLPLTVWLLLPLLAVPGPHQGRPFRPHISGWLARVLGTLSALEPDRQHLQDRVCPGHRTQ